jgi:predicted nucleotidyltransferase
MKMAVDQNLIVKLRAVLPGILDETPVTLAYLYGSMAAGQALPGSDVDIALVLCRTENSPAMVSKDRLKLEFAVEAGLEQQGILKPDVRVIDDMPLTFRGQVATQGIRLYSRDEVARVEFETRTWKEYLDFEPVARMMREAFFKDIREHGLFKR